MDDNTGMSNYWPWWAGAVGLAFVTINYTLITDRSLGISTAWDRVVHWRSERTLERQEAQFTDEAALAEALVGATVAHFGSAPEQPTPPVNGAGVGTLDHGHDVEPKNEKPSFASLRPAPLVTQVALLLSVFIGGVIASVTSGRFHLRYDMGEGFSRIVTHNSTTMVLVLFVGGVLVGFGTRLSGGCSSGHGLSGCGRLRPLSLVATAVFFGTAVLVSFLLWKVI
jgi:hypothetical protein